MSKALRIAFAWAVAGSGLLVVCAGSRAEQPAGAPGAAVAPKNIIVFVGDGCGFNHLATASLYLNGTTNGFAFQQFPVRLAASTYPAGGAYVPVTPTNFAAYGRKVTDSAAAATALATGVKTRNGAIGVDANGRSVSNILERAEVRGKRTGVVTSVPFSHATPAGFSVHAGSRASYAEIASNMVWRSRLDVIMGCGNPGIGAEPPPAPGFFRRLLRTLGLAKPAPAPAPSNGESPAGRASAAERRFAYVGGSNTWAALRAGKAGGDADGDGRPDAWTLIESREQFLNLARAEHPPARVAGVPRAANTLQQDRRLRSLRPFADSPREDVPTLAEMTAAALNVLDKGPAGFALMVEGGAIDWAAHSKQTGRMVEEVADFVRAVDTAVAWVDAHGGWDRTLIIVTADHETGYLWGAGSGQTESGPLWVPVTRMDGRGTTDAAWNSKGHTNQLVPLYARGRGAERFLDRVVGRDPLRGDYVDNTSVAQVVFECLDAPPGDP